MFNDSHVLFRLPIQRCEVVIVNSHVSGTHCDILDTPSHSVSKTMVLREYNDILIAQVLKILLYYKQIKKYFLKNLK